MDWTPILAVGGAAAAALALGPAGGYARITAGPKAQAAIRALAQKWGPIFGVPADWIMGVAKVESAFRPGARSTAASDAARGGSWGSMQVSLATAKGLAAELAKLEQAQVKATLRKWDGTGPSLLDPDLGVMFGAYFLSKLKRQLGADYARVAAAYNQGAGTVQKLVAAGRFPVGLTPHGRDYVEKTEAGRREFA